MLDIVSCMFIYCLLWDHRLHKGQGTLFCSLGVEISLWHVMGFTINVCCSYSLNPLSNRSTDLEVDEHLSSTILWFTQVYRAGEWLKKGFWLPVTCSFYSLTPPPRYHGCLIDFCQENSYLRDGSLWDFHQEMIWSPKWSWSNTLHY